MRLNFLIRTIILSSKLPYYRIFFSHFNAVLWTNCHIVSIQLGYTRVKLAGPEPDNAVIRPTFAGPAVPVLSEPTQVQVK